MYDSTSWGLAVPISKNFLWEKYDDEPQREKLKSPLILSDPGIIDFVWFGLFKFVFVLEVILIFNIIIFEVVFIIGDVFIFEGVFIFEVVLIA